MILSNLIIKFSSIQRYYFTDFFYNNFVRYLCYIYYLGLSIVGNDE